MKKAAFFACIFMFLSAHAASQAQMIITIQEVGGDVVTSGSGSFNTSGLTPGGSAASSALVWGGFPLGSVVELGPTTSTTVSVFLGISGPASFGGGSMFLPSTGSGDPFAVIANAGLYAPNGYVSGAPLSATNTYVGATINSLGLTPGTYTYTWGSGPTEGSATILIGVAAVPEPGPLALSAVTAASFAGLWRRRRAKAS